MQLSPYLKNLPSAPLHQSASEVLMFLLFLSSIRLNFSTGNASPLLSLSSSPLFSGCVAKEASSPTETISYLEPAWKMRALEHKLLSFQVNLGAPRWKNPALPARACWLLWLRGAAFKVAERRISFCKDQRFLEEGGGGLVLSWMLKTKGSAAPVFAPRGGP